MDAIDYVRAIRRGWPIVLIVTALALVVAVLTLPSSKAAESESRGYVASHILLRDTDVLTFGNARQAEDGELERFALRAKVGEVPERVAEEVGFSGTPAELAEKITATTDAEVGTLTITATDARQSRAETIANTVAAELLVTLEAQAQAAHNAELQAAERRRTEIEKQIAQLDADPGTRQSPVINALRNSLANQFGGASLEVAQLRAEGPQKPGFTTVQKAVAVPASSPVVGPKARQSLHMLVGMVIGLLAGLAVAVVVHRIDPRVWTKQGAEAAYGLPVIAEIPKLRHGQVRLAFAEGPPYMAEAYRMLRAPLLWAGVANLLHAVPEDASQANGNHPVGRTNGHVPSESSRPLRSLLVTSALPGEGKSTVVANLGAVLAEGGRSVVALDVNFRQPHLHDLYGEPRSPGIADMIEDSGGRERNQTSRLRVILRPTAVPRLSVATSGSPLDNPASAVPQARAVVESAHDLAEVVLVDSPPLLVVSDAGELIPAVDAVVLVCRAGATSVRAAVRVAEQLARSGASMLGVVLVGTTPGRADRRLRAYAPSRRPELVSEVAAQQTEATEPVATEA